MADAGSSPSDVETVDASRRTHLANERTYLAWWRTALTAFAVSLGAGKLVPELSGGTRWPYQLAGAGYALLGIVLLAYGLHRQRAVDRALAAGVFPSPDSGFLTALAGFGIALGILTLVLVLASP